MIAIISIFPYVKDIVVITAGLLLALFTAFKVSIFICLTEGKKSIFFSFQGKRTVMLNIIIYRFCKSYDSQPSL
jgi:hypothetical protein